ncbi:MAG TPA: DUF4386 domain-containing protein [Gemmatimonadaceae bacterium]|nr:DUF4386 domain-containing protein [Gemmatimonadaceae bacterium]
MAPQYTAALSGPDAPLSETSPSTRARILAGLYLFVIIGGIVAQGFIADGLVVANDAGKTAANILANKSLYRLAFTIFMVEMAAQVATTAMFYDLLKPVDRSVARLSAIMGLVASGIKTFARTFYYAPLILLSGASYLSAIEPTQLAALSLLFVKINNQGAAIALVFFGFETVLRGWLIYRSEFLPRFLGVLSMVGGFGWLTYLWPPLGSRAFVYVALFAIAGVILTTGWLFVRGVDDAKWRERAALAATSIWR